MALLAGMGLSIEAGLHGPLGDGIGHMWATFAIFGLGALLLSIGMIFGRPDTKLLFSQPRWMLASGPLGPIYVVALTIATPHIGVGLTMAGILFGRALVSLCVDHWGLLGCPKRPIDRYHVGALVAILLALCLIH
nr:DMT family transporter [Stenotrophomonas maltophilia]